MAVGEIKAQGASGAETPPPIEQLQWVIDSLIKKIDALGARLSALELDYASPAGDDLARFAERTGMSREDVFVSAMALYEAALDATERGERLVILTREYKFVREITGLEIKSQEKNQTSGLAAG